MHTTYHTPLNKKLGLGKDMHIALIHCPIEIVEKLRSHVFSIDTRLSVTKSYPFILYFINSKKEYESDFTTHKNQLQKQGSLFIAWQKKSANSKSEVRENYIREIGLQNGLVDVKVVAIDQIWSGLKFVYFLKDRT